MEARRVAADTPHGKSSTPVRVRARTLWSPALMSVGLVVLLSRVKGPGWLQRPVWAVVAFLHG
jgi:hypothetical protein